MIVSTTNKSVDETVSLDKKDLSNKNDIGTKADIALGGVEAENGTSEFTSEREQSNVSAAASASAEVNAPVEANIPVNVPLPAAEVRHYVESKPTKVELDKPVSKKVSTRQKYNDSQQLLERAAIKLMEHDLDRLLLK